jgi:hypothetical protein
MKKDSTSRENIDASSKRTTEKRLIQDSEESQVFQNREERKNTKKNTNSFEPHLRILQQP